MSEDEFKQAKAPPKSSSPRGKEGRSGSPKGKGKGKRGSRAESPGPRSHCHAFAKTGTCPREEKLGKGKCIFPRKTKAQIEAEKKAAAAKGSAVPAEHDQGCCDQDWDGDIHVAAAAIPGAIQHHVVFNAVPEIHEFVVPCDTQMDPCQKQSKGLSAAPLICDVEKLRPPMQTQPLRGLIAEPAC
jgi:hypothetical protein